MRIANNTTIYNFLSSLNKSQNRMNDIQEQLSDGRIVHRPSDDPIRAFRGLRLNVNLTMNEQYTQNANDGLQWLKQTDTSLQNLSDIMQSAKELVIRAVNANPTVTYDTLSTELDGLINQAVRVANTQIGDRYIFAGQKDKLAAGILPFERRTINIDVAGVSTPTEVVVYNGDYNKISMPVQAGAADPTKDSINVHGEEVFGPVSVQTQFGGAATYATVDIFSQLIRIKDELKNHSPGHPNLTWLSTAAVADIDRGHDRILVANTEIGARMANYEMAINFMKRDNTAIAENMSANDDLDLAKATIDFKNNENVYRAALAVGARIMPPSLVDFLR